MGFCSSLVWVYTIILLLPCCSEHLLTLWPSIQDISMKLPGYIGHGPNSSYPDLCPDMSCCHGIMTENVLKNGVSEWWFNAKKWTNECTNCEVPGRDGQNSFIP